MFWEVHVRRMKMVFMRVVKLNWDTIVKKMKIVNQIIVRKKIFFKKFYPRRSKYAVIQFINIMENIVLYAVRNCPSFKTLFYFPKVTNYKKVLVSINHKNMFLTPNKVQLLNILFGDKKTPFPKHDSFVLYNSKTELLQSGIFLDAIYSLFVCFSFLVSHDMEK